MKSYILPLIFLAIFIQSCREKENPAKAKQIFNQEFNWKIDIPEGFESVSPDQWRKMQNKGAEVIEDTYDTQIENRSKTIFVFKSGQFHYFESNYQLFDTATDGDYLENFRNVNELLFGTFEAQMPDAKLDSASFQENIDGLLFQAYKINISIPDKLVMEFWMYSRLFGNKEFTVNIMTADKEKQRILLEAWRGSKFGDR